MGKDVTIFVFVVVISTAVVIALAKDLSFLTDLLFSACKLAGVYFMEAAGGVMLPQLRSLGLLYVRGRRVIWLLILLIEAVS